LRVLTTVLVAVRQPEIKLRSICCGYSIQKQRAVRNKDEAEQVRSQLLDRDAVIADQRAELNRLKAHCHQLSRDKDRANDDTSALQMSVCEA